MHSNGLAIAIIALGIFATSYAQSADANTDPPIKVGKHPIGSVINEKTNTIYIANSGSSNISVINASLNQVIDTIDVNVTKDLKEKWEGRIGSILKDEIMDIDINPATNVIYVAKAYHFSLLPTGDASSQILLVINGSNNRIVNKIDISSDLSTLKMSVDPNKNLLYFIFSSPFFCTGGSGECGMRFPEKIYALNGSTNTWGLYGYVGYDNALDIAFDPKTNITYIVRLDDPSHTTLLAYDGLSANFSKSFPVELFGTQGNITGMAFDPEGDKIYMIVNSLSSPSFVAAVERSSGKVLGKLDIPKPSDIDLNPETNKAYVTHPNDNLVSIIDLSALKTIKTIAVSDRPVSVEVTPESNTVYIVGQASDSVTVIDGNANTIVPEFGSASVGILIISAASIASSIVAVKYIRHKN